MVYIDTVVSTFCLGGSIHASGEALLGARSVLIVMRGLYNISRVRDQGRVGHRYTSSVPSSRDIVVRRMILKREGGIGYVTGVAEEREIEG